MRQSSVPEAFVRQTQGHGSRETLCPPVNLPPITRTRSQSAAPQQCPELLPEMEVRKDTGGLEAVGSKGNSSTPPAEPGEIQTQAPVPALRFCGQLAQWTGNSADRQGEVGISSCIFFEALPGEMASSCLELHNQGSTAIFYSWQRLDGSTSISRLLPPRKQVCFYFNQSSAVILPGETRQMDLMFKSGTPGLHTESWRLKTHPSLLRGASVQVTLMGLALHQDRTAALRRLLEVRLEETVTENFCRSLLYRMLEGIQTPERPRTLAEFLLESPPSESSGEQESETLDLDDRS